MKVQNLLISRRKLIKQGAVLSLYPLFSGLLKAAPKPVLPTDDRVWHDIVDYARWCPSVHNLQPHKLKILSPTEAVLHYDTTRLLPVGDPDSIFATVAMGVFIEHLSIAANPYGLRVEASILDPITVHKSGIIPFANLRLVPSQQPENLSRDLFKKRRTSRVHYQHKQVEDAVLQKISEFARLNNYEFHSTANQTDVDFVVSMNQKTLFEDISNDADRLELDHLFRYNQQEAERKKDGLWAKCMGFPGGIMKMVFRHPEQWQEEPLSTVLRSYYKSSFKGTSTIGWFRGNFSNTGDYLAAGRMLARNWLLITQQGLYIQPFGSLITNVNAYKKLNERLSKPGDQGKLWMLFRMGYSKEPTRSYRLDLQDILI